MKWLLVNSDKGFLEAAGECLEDWYAETVDCSTAARGRRCYRAQPFDGVIADERASSLLADIRCGALRSPGVDRERVVLVLSEARGLEHVGGLFRVDQRVKPAEFAWQVRLAVEAGTGPGAFWRAVLEDDVERVNECLNADPELLNFRRAEGCAALHSASYKVSLLLLERGAEVDIRGCWQQTPLHLVLFPEVARLLLRFGADPHATDRSGKTPLDLAVDAQYPEVIAILKAAMLAG